jgi:hypothetical protein
MGVLIDGVWTDGELPQEYGEAADLAIGVLRPGFETSDWAYSGCQL